MTEKQNRIFTGVIYPDSEDYDCEQVLDCLDDCFEQWAFCLHDSDVDENGKLKKPHIHWVGKRTPVVISTVAKKLGISSHHVEKGRNFKALVRYLIHLDSPDKFQYSSDGITANFDLVDFLNITDEGAQVIDLIDTCITEQLSFYQLAVYASRNHLWSTYRRNYTIIKDLMTIPKNLWDIPASPPPRSRELTADNTDYDIVLYK